jgi:hypothetical protein
MKGESTMKTLQRGTTTSPNHTKDRPKGIESPREGSSEGSSDEPTARRIQGRLGGVAVVICFLAASAFGQDKSPATERQRFNTVPTSLGPAVSAVGPRLNVKGKERTVFTGQYIDDTGTRFPVRMIHQLPNLVSLEGFGKNAATLKFDGKKTTLRKSAANDALIETLASDTCEGMLASIQKGAAVRLLGRFFKPDLKEDPNYKGDGFDVYEVSAAVSSVTDQPVRMKFYSFDSISGLLASTRYKDDTQGRGKDVEIRFSNWQKVNGSDYAGQIDRYENGRLIFSIVWTGVTNGARVTEQTFSEATITK